MFNPIMKLTAVAFFAAATIIGTQIAKADDIAIFQKQAINPVVQLERNCSGSVVNTSSKETTYILTAEHCFGGDATAKSGTVNIDVKEEGSSKLVETKSYIYDIVTKNLRYDLAVLRLRAKNLNLDGVTIATEDPREGETVWTVGYSLGLERMITEGHYGGFSNLDIEAHRFDPYGNAMEVYRATPAIVGGNSGGAMFVKRGENYEQVGVTYAGFPTYFVYGLYHTQKQINEILQSAMSIDATKEVPKIEQGKKND